MFFSLNLGYCIASSLPVVQGCLLAFLPLAAFLTIFRVLRLRGEGWRAAALGSATVWGVLLVLITECLSVPRLITRPALALSWSAVTLGFLFYGWLLQRGASESPKLRTTDETPGQTFTRLDWIAISGTAILLGLIGLTAILSAPNTWDAMAYHMSRVAQWMTNRDVNLYPAFYSAQLFLSPWAEYAILHLDVLFGGDRLVNLVEFLSMIGTVAGVSLIAEQLGAGRRGQLLAAIACATLTEGVLEASGAMNTYVGAFWIVVAVYYLLRWRNEQSLTVILALGSSMGLAIFTKGTAYLFLPCILLACWWSSKAQARKLLLIRLPILLVVVLVLNGPLFIRNYRLSGSPLGFSTPLGNDPERQYSNSHISPSVMFA